jgi:hypothetical protein
MSPAYRADPLAQAIEEAARIFGPEVTAAALLLTNLVLDLGRAARSQKIPQ